MSSKNYIFKIYNNINILLKMVSICYNLILLIFVISTYLYNSERKTHVAHMLHKVIRMEYYFGGNIETNQWSKVYQRRNKSMGVLK